MEKESILSAFKRMWYHITIRLKALQTLITNKTSWKDF